VIVPVTRRPAFNEPPLSVLKMRSPAP